MCREPTEHEKEVIRAIAEIPDEMYEMYKKTDFIRADMIEKCRAVAENLDNPSKCLERIKSTESSVTSNGPSVSPSLDVADQIRKLADLKKEGMLTDDEFTAQKRKLLRI